MLFWFSNNNSPHTHSRILSRHQRLFLNFEMDNTHMSRRSQTGEEGRECWSPKQIKWLSIKRSENLVRSCPTYLQYELDYREQVSKSLTFRNYYEISQTWNINQTSEGFLWQPTILSRLEMDKIQRTLKPQTGKIFICKKIWTPSKILPNPQHQLDYRE